MTGFLRALHGFEIRSLILNVVVALSLVFAVEAALFAFAGHAREPIQGGPLVGPLPGALVALVWTALFTGLAVVKWRLQIVPDQQTARRAIKWVVVLLGFCAAYPVYTAGLELRLVGFIGNLATIVMAAWVLVLVGRVDRVAALGPLAVIAWVSFASIVIVDQARWLW